MGCSGSTCLGWGGVYGSSRGLQRCVQYCVQGLHSCSATRWRCSVESSILPMTDLHSSSLVLRVFLSFLFCSVLEIVLSFFMDFTDECFLAPSLVSFMDCVNLDSWQPATAPSRQEVNVATIQPLCHGNWTWSISVAQYLGGETAAEFSVFDGHW